MHYDRSVFFFDARRKRFAMRRDFGISEAILAASVAASAAGGIAASRMASGKAPPLQPVVAEPDANDPKRKLEAERKAEADAAREGRASTVLSQDNRPTSLLGSVAPYSNTRLGS